MHRKSPSQPPENQSEKLSFKKLRIAADLPFIHHLRSGWYADFYCSAAEDGWVEYTVFPVAMTREDEAFRHFEAEVQKMREVKANSKASISLIQGYGLTEPGQFPYLETIESDSLSLSELCTKSSSTVYSLGEIGRICEQLTRALAHCHNSGLIHGAISSSTVRLNGETNQYQLCGFGPSFLTAPQRLEFIKKHSNTGLPSEQLNGDLFCQTDIFAFSTLIFNLLLARAQGELPVEILSARENFYKDLIQLRSRAIAALDWTEEEKSAEAAVPRWMMDLIYNSLHINPRNRFSHGSKLYDFVLLNHVLPKEKVSEPGTYNRPRVKETKQPERKKPTKSMAVFSVAVLVAAVFLFGFLHYRKTAPVAVLPEPPVKVPEQNQGKEDLRKQEPSFPGASAGKPASAKAMADKPASATADKNENRTVRVEKKEPVRVQTVTKNNPVIAVASKTPAERKVERKPVVTPKIRPEDTKGHCSTLNLNTGLGAYKVKSFAYFHNDPDESTRRKAFINHWNNTVLHAIKEENGFIYIVFTNYWGQTSKGWLKKSDVMPLEQDPSSAAK